MQTKCVSIHFSARLDGNELYFQVEIYLHFMYIHALSSLSKLSSTIIYMEIFTSMHTT